MPTIEELRKSQQQGGEGKGTSEQTFAEKMGGQNLGTGLGEGSDQEFPQAGAGNGGKGF